MFDNIAEKIKTIAKINLALGWIASFVWGILLMNSNYPLEGFMLMIAGFIGTWIVSIFLYAVGHLIDNTDKIVESNRILVTSGQTTTSSPSDASISDRKEETYPVEKVLQVDTYNPDIPIRNIKLYLSKEGYLYMDFVLTKALDISALRAQISLTTFFFEEMDLGVIEFMELTSITPTKLRTEKVYLTEIQDLASKAKATSVHIEQYMQDEQVMIVSTPDQPYTMENQTLAKKRAIFGQDIVGEYNEDAHSWTCMCGKINSIDDNSCILCDRVRIQMIEGISSGQEAIQGIWDFANREQTTTTKQIYDYAQASYGDVEDDTLQKLLGEIKDLAQLEKYYGLSIKTVRDKIETYLHQ